MVDGRRAAADFRWMGVSDARQQVAANGLYPNTLPGLGNDAPIRAPTKRTKAWPRTQLKWSPWPHERGLWVWRLRETKELQVAFVARNAGHRATSAWSQSAGGSTKNGSWCSSKIVDWIEKWSPTLVTLLMFFVELVRLDGFSRWTHLSSKRPMERNLLCLRTLMKRLVMASISMKLKSPSIVGELAWQPQGCPVCALLLTSSNSTSKEDRWDGAITHGGINL